MVENWLAICVEIVYFHEVKVTVFILKEVTDERVHRALILSIDVSLWKDLVDGFYRTDSVRVWVRHALDFDSTFGVILVTIYLEYTL